jgi:hypothetical protein
MNAEPAQFFSFLPAIRSGIVWAENGSVAEIAHGIGR